MVESLQFLPKTQNKVASLQNATAKKTLKRVVSKVKFEVQNFNVKQL